MGFNKCFISSVENLKKEFKSKGLEGFVKSYRKYDAITGPSESFQFLEDKVKEYELQQIQMVDKGENKETTTN
jgi:hypothetical protein